MWWLLIPFGLIGALVLKNKAAAATTQSNASQGLSTNPLQEFWEDANAYGATAGGLLTTTKANASNAITDAGGTFGAIFGGGAKGTNSPSTSGSGAGGPTQQQVDATDIGTDAGPDSDGSDDFGGGGGDDYGD